MATNRLSKALADRAEFKGVSRLAGELGVTRQVLTYWIERGIPDRHLIAVEKKTGIPRQQLRPDLYL